MALTYAGAFDPSFSLGDLTGSDRAVLGREWMLHGHLQDRAGMPLYLARSSPADMEKLAIDEWMSASPIYTKRMQRALRFEGDDVPTLFKNLQLDVGAPHQFLDFRFRVHHGNLGEFWLAHCGALMDVEPLGQDFVVGMCHHIEDPTFDATAAAVNPRARVRPRHRPPRVPPDRSPHCHWEVTIEAGASPLDEHPNLALMRRSRLAALDSASLSGPGYEGPFDPDFQLEDLSAPAQVAALEEFAVQAHLLARAYMLCVGQRLGEDEALTLGYRTLTGQAGITAERLVRAFGLTQPGADTIGKLLQLHPILQPRSYLDAQVEVVDDRRCRLAIGAAPVTEEADSFHWLGCVDRHGCGPLDAIARAVAPTAAWQPTSCRPGERRAYELVIGPQEPVPPEPVEMALIRLSTGATFHFRSRR